MMVTWRNQRWGWARVAALLGTLRVCRDRDAEPSRQLTSVAFHSGVLLRSLVRSVLVRVVRHLGVVAVQLDTLLLLLVRHRAVRRNRRRWRQKALPARNQAAWEAQIRWYACGKCEMRLAAPLEGRIEGAFGAGSRHRRAWALCAPGRIALMAECGCVGLRCAPMPKLSCMRAGKDGIGVEMWASHPLRRRRLPCSFKSALTNPPGHNRSCRRSSYGPRQANPCPVGGGAGRQVPVLLC